MSIAGFFVILLSYSSLSAALNSTNSTANDTSLANDTTSTTFMVKSLPTDTTTTTSTNGNTILTTSTPSNANIFQLKTICTCQMDTLDDTEMITCPNNFKISIYSADLYDINNTDCVRTDSAFKAGYITSIQGYLANYCTGTNCSISESDLINRVDITHRQQDVVCLAADIKWFCYQFTTTYSIVSTTTSAYGFTYFFYIITLILSSSCILIGAIFILRRFLMIRRHASQSRSRRAAQRAYSAHVAHMNMYNGMNAGSNIWALTYAPPAYDHIYESSHPINPPPDYNSIANNVKLHYLKAEDQVVVIYPNPNEPNALQPQQQQTTTLPQQPEQPGEFSLQPLYITSVVNPNLVVEPGDQQLNQITPSTLEETVGGNSSGQLNLAFKPENPQSTESTGASSANESTTVKHDYENVNPNTQTDAPAAMLKAP